MNGIKKKEHIHCNSETARPNTECAQINARSDEISQQVKERTEISVEIIYAE